MVDTSLLLLLLLELSVSQGAEVSEMDLSKHAATACASPVPV
ncbi:hypothetical protein [Arthrobacter sp. NPDC058127]